jgi:ribosomal-protein-alanine N-acetyltransferase
MIEADLPVVLALEREIFPDPWPESGFLQQMSSFGWGAIVAESGGTITGYACYMMVAAEGHLTNIAVPEAHRRKLVAKRLLEAIIQVIKKAGCEFILLEVRPSNEAAIAFYRKYGFQDLYRRPRYYRYPVEDALVMVLHWD